jgi:hypothetical protein
MIEPRLGQVLEFSHYHLQSAHYMASRSFKIEKEFISQKIDGIPYFSLIAYVTSCIFLSVAFLESRINELIMEVTDNISNPWNKGAISDDDLIAFRRINIGQKRDPHYSKILEKYQIVLLELGRSQFYRNRNPYQNVHILIKLRNDLIHFQPEVVLVEPRNPSEEHKLLRTFKHKFPMNPIAKSLNHLQYPDIILGYGCARWAVNSSIEFVSEFNNHINLTQSYAGFMNLPEGVL